MASVTYPFTLPSLVASLDGNAMKAVDFNRMILQINAIEATLGPNPGGASPTVAQRLYDAVAPDGMQKGGVICEVDPSSPQTTQGTRATRRWFYDKLMNDTTDNNGEYPWPDNPTVGSGFQTTFPYNIFDAGVPPVVFTLYFNSGTGTDAMLFNRGWGVIQYQSQYLWRYKVYTSKGAGYGVSISQTMAFLALGTLEIFDDTAPVMWRTDNFGTPPGT